MINLKKASSRNTDAHWVCLGNRLSVLYSYETPMGFSGYIGDQFFRLRRPHHISNTTARHLTETGVREYTKTATDEEFEEKLEQAFLSAIHPQLPNLLTTLQEVSPK